MNTELESNTTLDLAEQLSVYIEQCNKAALIELYNTAFGTSLTVDDVADADLDGSSIN